MYCCNCGARNPDDAVYCHQCGTAMYGTGPASKRRESTQPSKPTNAKPTEEERQLVEELLPIDQKAHECHACGRTEDLYGWDFGLAKTISKKRAWGGTAWSVAVSAVTLPLMGVGGLQLPGRKARLRVLRLRLILCGACHQQHMALGRRNQIDVAAYGLHPWWAAARRLGYTEFLEAKDLNRLQSKK